MGGVVEEGGGRGRKLWQAVQGGRAGGRGGDGGGSGGGGGGTESC